MAQPDYTDPADGQNAKAEQVVDTIVNVADKFRRIRIIGSIISFVVVLVVMAVFLLNTKQEIKQEVEQQKEEQAAQEAEKEAAEEKRKVSFTLDGKTFYVGTTFKRTINSAIENGLKVSYHKDLSINAKKYFIDEDNKEKSFSSSINSFGASYGMVILAIETSETNFAHLSSMPTDGDAKLGDLRVSDLDTTFLANKNFSIDGKKLILRSTTSDEYKELFGQPVCEVKNSQYSGGKSSVQSEYFSYVHPINDINIVSVFKKEGNTLNDASIDVAGISQTYCSK